MITLTETDDAVESRARELFREDLTALHQHTDRLFAHLMILQWLVGIIAAMSHSESNLPVLAAIVLGGAITSLPVFLAWKHPGKPMTRHTIVIAQLLFSALLIHLTGGRIETHFHIIGSLALLAIYRDWPVLFTALVVIVTYHGTRDWFWSEAMIGVFTPGPRRWFEHLGWSLLGVGFLITFMRRGLGEMNGMAIRRAKLERQMMDRTTELTAATRKLQRSDERFSSAFEYASIGMALVSPSGRWLKVNRALCHLLGYQAEELHEKTFQDLTHPDDLEADLVQLKQVLAGEIDSYQIKKRYFHKSGNEVWAMLSVSLVRDGDGQPDYFVSQIQDITLRKEAEAALRTSEAEFRVLAEAMPQIIWVTRSDGWHTHFNQRWLDYTGLTLEESVGHGWLPPFHPEDQPLAAERWKHANDTGNPYEIEYRLRGADGNYRWMLGRAVPLLDAAGGIVKWFGTCTDIHDLKAAELEISRTNRELRESDERFHQLADHISDVFWITSPDLDAIHYISPGYDRIWGRSTGSLYANPHQRVEAILPEDRDTALAAFARIMGDAPEMTVEYRIARPDGSIHWIHDRGFQVRDAEGELVRLAGIASDITARKQSETELEKTHAELVKSSRLAGMSEVATSVIHNVGNVLNSVNISCSVVADRVRKSRVGSVVKTAALLREHEHDLTTFVTDERTGKRLPEFLDKLAQQLVAEQSEILRELKLLGGNIDHIKDIVAMQQNYARVSGVTESIHIADLIEDSLRMIEGSLERHSVRVSREFEEVPPITIEKHKALQILVNLIGNAKHACEESGRDDKQVTLRVAAGSDCIRISVIDNGVGITPDNLTRIFAHGFTTKLTGHGFGLHSGALAAIEMGGSLTVHSDGPGTGAAFTLELPIQPAPAAPAFPQ